METIGFNAVENAMQEVAVAALLRCLDTSGNSKVITPNNLLTNVVSDKGGFDYDNQEVINRLLTPGCYDHGDKIVGTMGGYGILLVLRARSYIAQVDFVSNGRIFFRFSPNIGISWTPWKVILFT